MAASVVMHSTYGRSWLKTIVRVRSSAYHFLMSEGEPSWDLYGALLAVLAPTRGPQDRMARTFVVPE